ncbi:transcriptional regulator, LysR family [Micromonospora eburnea]|uniref:Transcriptional regulator, LysR family n=1 Tax=Micromonospora eburnea TaxID=227316 RepID=A0A1C6U975_9ACTN|nr:transcriptional regulator, LysR family [Micromonospora eburnea]
MPSIVRSVVDYDIGMIRVFVLVYETASATATAERLFISQPSVSYTLRRLRNLFNDPLFLRRGNRLEPTPIAEDLYPRLRQLIESMDEVMSHASRFRPEESTRTFRLRLTDVGVTGLLPRILHRIRTEAPHVVLDVGALTFSTVVRELRSGQADAVICATRLDAPDLLREPLFTQAYVGVCAPDHPRIGATPTLAEFEFEQHVGVAGESGHRSYDLRIGELGIDRKVALVIPSFSGLPAVLAGTELLSFAPSSAAQRFESNGLLRVFALPFDVPISESALYTVRRELPSTEFDWFRRSLIEALR